MKFEPYEYQKTAVAWVEEHPRCCLFLDMGLGKSVITLTAVSNLIDLCDVSKVLVVAPKKVAESTWATEAAKWDHLRYLQVVRVMGTEKQRIKALETEADVYVLGRDSFVWLMKHYNGRLPFDMLILDELTSFKSPKSVRFKAMKLATPRMSRVVGLTGTPAPNGLVDLWAQMYCVDMGRRLGRSVTRYRDAYFNSVVWNNIAIKHTLKPGAEKHIRDKIADICLSMQAADYLQLPAMMVHDIEISLPEKIMKGYTDFERDRVMEFKQQTGEDSAVLASSAATLMAKLSQYANGAVYDEDGEWHRIHDEKISHLREIVEQAASPVLVFYQFKHDVTRIAEALKDCKVRIYEGDADLRDWNAGNIDVLLAHPASTAYGLNMQHGGHYIVWFGTGWNLELYQQANARLHRQGQKHTVTVYRLVCTGTVDMRAAAALEGKRSTQQALMDELRFLVGKYS